MKCDELKDRWFWAYPTESVDCDGITGSAHEVYSKSEADKVIADLEDKLHNVSGILKETREWLIESQKLHKRCADNAVKVIRRQKYKRCLAMAKLCAKNVDHLNSEGYIYEKEGYAKELVDCITGTEFYDKWYNRWLELAEKFKEAK